MKLLFIQTTSPHGAINAQEGLDALLMGSAFSECAVLFLGEGVLQLIPNQDPSTLGTKNFSKTFGALRDYGVGRIYCDTASLEKYDLTTDDLIIQTEALSPPAMRLLLAEHEKVLTF